MTRSEFVQQAVLSLIRAGITQQYAIDEADRLANALAKSGKAPWSEDEAIVRGYARGVEDGRNDATQEEIKKMEVARSKGAEPILVTSEGYTKLPDDQFIRGIPRPITYSNEELLRIVNAAWDIQHLLPHPDDERTWATEIREFHRALQKLAPLETIEAVQHNKKRKLT